MSTDNVKAVGFESFKRENPNVKQLASLWRGTPEFDAWMGLYLDKDNTTTLYFEEDDHKIGTFYRNLTESEVVNTITPEPEPVPEGQKPYENLGIVHEHSDAEQTHAVTHVKLGIPRWHLFGNRFGLVEYVFVDQYRREVSDENGRFTVLNTRVVVTDEEGERYDDAEPIYIAPSFLAVWEALCAIGELPNAEEIGEIDGN